MPLASNARLHPPPSTSEEEYGRILRPYLEEPGSLFVVSSDFCLWGSRFQYTRYDPKEV